MDPRAPHAPTPEKTGPEGDRRHCRACPRGSSRGPSPPQRQNLEQTFESTTRSGTSAPCGTDPAARCRARRCTNDEQDEDYRPRRRRRARAPSRGRQCPHLACRRSSTRPTARAQPSGCDGNDANPCETPTPPAPTDPDQTHHARAPARGRAHVYRWQSSCNSLERLSSRRMISGASATPPTSPVTREPGSTVSLQHIGPGNPRLATDTPVPDPAATDPRVQGRAAQPRHPRHSPDGPHPLNPLGVNEPTPHHRQTPLPHRTRHPTPARHAGTPSPPVPARATSTAHPRALAHSSGSSTRAHAGRQHTTCSSAPATRGGRTTSDRHPHPGQRTVVTRRSGSSTGHRADALDAAGPRSASMSATHGIPAHSSSSGETQEASTPAAPGSRTPTTSASLDQTSPVTGSSAAHASVTHRPGGRGARTPRASATCPHQDASTATRSSATPSASGYRHLGPAARPAPDPPDGDDTDGTATSNR